MHKIIPLALLALIAAGQPAWSNTYSQLWGENGEQWSPTSRLPDFSHAGYRRGEKPIPDIPVVANVLDFGAVGDGEHDDSEAFINAIESVDAGAILIPEGRYKITEILEITKPGIVLRGEGPRRTILYFPIPLNDVRPNMGATTGGRPTSNYSWSGGFIWIRGNFQTHHLTGIAASAKRGDARIAVEDGNQLDVGQEVEIWLEDNEENTLARHLYSDDPGDMDELRARTRARLTTLITGIDGDIVEIDRPLRFDIEMEWKPAVRSFAPTVVECGVESLGFEFPPIPYEGHFTELGNNAIAITGAAHCWARDIHILNSDSGFFIGGRFCTTQGVVFDTERAPDSTNCTGHHGVYISNDDNLFTDFEINQRFIHDLTVSHCAGNVFSNGVGIDVCLDHHKRNPYENLFTHIDLGAGTRMWRSGGGAALGRHCAARGTFWNIRAEEPQSHPGGFGPASMNLVAVQTGDESILEEEGVWFEAISPDEIFPANLHEAQVELRLE